MMALVDDSIKRLFHNKRSLALTIPSKGAKTPLKLEYVGAKRIVDEIFRRNSSNMRPSALRQHSIAAC
jgi:hypothetical protein